MPCALRVSRAGSARLYALMCVICFGVGERVRVSTLCKRITAQHHTRTHARAHVRPKIRDVKSQRQTKSNPHRPPTIRIAVAFEQCAPIRC